MAVLATIEESGALASRGDHSGLLQTPVKEQQEVAPMTNDVIYRHRLRVLALAMH